MSHDRAALQSIHEAQKARAWHARVMDEVMEMVDLNVHEESTLKSIPLEVAFHSTFEDQAYEIQVATEWLLLIATGIEVRMTEFRSTPA